MHLRLRFIGTFGILGFSEKTRKVRVTANSTAFNLVLGVYFEVWGCVLIPDIYLYVAWYIGVGWT